MPAVMAKKQKRRTMTEYECAKELGLTDELGEEIKELEEKAELLGITFDEALNMDA